MAFNRCVEAGETSQSFNSFSTNINNYEAEAAFCFPFKAEDKLQETPTAIYFLAFAFLVRMNAKVTSPGFISKQGIRAKIPQL